MTFTKEIGDHLAGNKSNDQEKSNVRMTGKVADLKPAAASGNAKAHGVATVQSTNQYHLFKQVSSNREVNNKHVVKLMAAISKKNLLHLNPIVVNADMEVIDGQHRLEAAKRMKLPVYYIQEANIGRNDIAGMNSNKKVWTIMDYVNFFAVEGNADFKRFSELCNKHPEITPSWMQSLCSATGKRLTGAIKNGKIDITNLDKAHTWATYFKDYAKYIPTVYSSRFIEGSVSFFTSVKYDHQVMMQRIRDNQDLILPYATAKEYTRMLRKIFNKT